MDGYLDQGYNYIIDNFYTSPTLASDLFEWKTHIIGTSDRTRKGIPPEVNSYFKELSLRHKCRGKELFVRDGRAVYSTWNDTKYLTVCLANTQVMLIPL